MSKCVLITQVPLCAYVHIRIYISKRSMFMLYQYALHDVFLKQWTDWSTLPEFAMSQL